MKRGIEIHIVANNNTARSKIFCNREIYFKNADSTGHLLGFKLQILKSNKVHQSDSPMTIIRVNSLRIECNVTLRKKFMQQNFFCCPDKTFCLSIQNLNDIAKCFVGTTKEIFGINTNKIFLLI